jgi:hypothetical protein
VHNREALTTTLPLVGPRTQSSLRRTRSAGPLSTWSDPRRPVIRSTGNPTISGSTRDRRAPTASDRRPEPRRAGLPEKKAPRHRLNGPTIQMSRHPDSSPGRCEPLGSRPASELCLAVRSLGDEHGEQGVGGLPDRRRLLWDLKSGSAIRSLVRGSPPLTSSAGRVSSSPSCPCTATPVVRSSHLPTAWATVGSPPG